MTKKKVLVKDILNIEQFDPLNLDLSYIQEELNALPKNGQIDINMAEVYATRWLRAADYCGEIYAKMVRWMGIKKTIRNEQLAAAGIRSGHHSATAQKQLAPMDPQYIQAANDYTDAEACVLLLKSKYASLMAAHYLAKELLRRNIEGEKANTFQSESDEGFSSDEKVPGRIDSPEFEGWEIDLSLNENVDLSENSDKHNDFDEILNSI